MMTLFESAIGNEHLLSESDKHNVVDAVVDAIDELKSPNDLNAFIAKHEEQ